VNRSYLKKRIIKNAFILVCLSLLILLPGLFLGWVNLHQAAQAIREGRFTEASRAYASAANHLPWQPSLWEKAAESALSGGDPSTALPFYARAAEKDALSPQGWLAWGDACQQTGDLPAAIATWKAAIGRNNPSEALYSRIARAYRRQGDYPSALEAWRIALTFNSENAEAHYQLGLLLSATTPELALPELMQAAQLDPLLDASVQSLRTSLNAALIIENPPYLLLVSGRALAAIDEWDLAEEAFRRAILIRREYAEAWALLGEARQHLGADGLSDLQMALQLETDSPLVNGLNGLYWQRIGEPAKSLEFFQKAITLEPDNAAWQTAAGGASEQAGDLVGALVYFKQAALLDPHGVETLRLLAGFCARYQVEVSETGLPAARRGLELRPEDWQSQDVMGQVTQAAGDPMGAEIYYLRSVELAPGEAAPHLHLAILYLQMGKTQPACDNLLKVKNLDPQGSYGLQAGRLLEQYFP